MERGEIECEVIRISDSSEMDFSDEIEEEFSAVMENVKSEVDTKPVISPKVFEEYLQYYEVSPPLRCRLCAIPDNDMVNIFNSDNMDRSIIEKIERCLPIVVEETDPLSKHACRSCLASLELCYQFHKTVAKAEQQLLALERPTKEPRNREPPKRSDNKRPLDQSLDVKTSSNKRRTVVVKSNVEFVELESRSPPLCDARTLGNNNSNTKSSRHSSDAESSMGKFYSAQHSSAPIFNHENTSDVKTGSNKRRTVVVKSNVEFVDLESQSPRLCDARTLGNNNSNTKSSRHSSDAQSSMGKIYFAQHSSAPTFNQENTCDLEVLEIAESTTFRSKSRKKVKHNPVESDIHEVCNAYGCDFCPKKFNTKGELVVHRKIHFRKIPYSLKLSARDRTSSRKTSMRQDPANHSEASNDRSSVCNELSNSSSSGNSLAVAKSIQKWQCATCTESFWKIGDLNKHLKSCKLQNLSP